LSKNLLDDTSYPQEVEEGKGGFLREEDVE
jgi:hypothetical protein